MIGNTTYQETFIISRNGFDFEFIRWGNAKKPTWLFIHGFGGSARTFSKVALNLAEAGECLLTVSLPFHGNSSDAIDSSQLFDIKIVGELFSEIVKTEFGMDQYHAVSHSLGSRIVLWLAVNKPDDLISIHIMNPAGFYPWEIRFFSFFSEGWKTHLLEFDLISRLVTSFLVPNPSLRTIEAFKWLAKSYPSMCLHRTKVFIQLFKISKQVHIYWGDKDRLLPLEFAQEVKQHFVSATVHIIQNCGHLPMIEQPNELTKLLLKNRNLDLIGTL
jgi:abhydrolase domain-containing protein 6